MITSLMKKQDTKETPVTSSNNNEELPATSCNSPQTSITIPTSNQFDIFNEISNPTTNQSLPELPTNPPTESNPQTPTKPPPTTNLTPESTTQNIQPDPESEQMTTTRSTSIEAETIILCDSNRRHIKPDLLCPNSTNYYIRCPTLHHAKEIIQDQDFSNPQCIILHTGTNDLEKVSNEELINTYEQVTELIKTKYPNCQLITSGLLPRKDELNMKIPQLNGKLEEIDNKENYSFVSHDNIGAEELKDKKHLTKRG
jgi:hypothetical protein